MLVDQAAQVASERGRALTVEVDDANTLMLDALRDYTTTPLHLVDIIADG